ncbi:MAG: CheR family methyltransferase [Treponemataceae bacterium]|nr:CheR family methyltransferase [Treponemataceae bacterium]
MENTAEKIVTLNNETEDNVDVRKDSVVNIDFKMVAFSLAGKDYAIDILKVKEIAKAGRFTYVPNTSPFVLGVYNLRGEIIPIIDLRLFFNIDVPPRTGNEIENMIIVTVEEQIFGVVVDAIDKVVGIQKSTIQPPHPLFGDISIKYIAGVVESNNHLYILLDIDRIFGSKAPKIEHKEVPTQQMNDSYGSGSQKIQQAIQPVKKVVEEPKTIDFSFIKDGLQNYKRFTVSPVNMEWIRNRYDSWEKERGKNLQLTNDSDAEEFLKSFYSMHTGSFWSESYANQVFDSLPNNDARQIVVWNPGCGKGYETYSLACILKKRYPEARIKIYAHEVDLLSISNAPLLALPSDAAESWYKPFTSKTVSGEYTFIQNIKDMILFEYHDCMHTNAMPAVDIIFARDILSFMNEQGQTDLLNEFGEKVKGNGCLILGDNEQVPAGNTSWSASSANQISMYLKH